MIWILIAATAYVWDNDGGGGIYDPELQERVGCEYNLVRALRDVIGGDSVTVSTLLPSLNTLLKYDMLFIVNGWRRDTMIGAEERDTIRRYLEAGKCVYMEGNNVNIIISGIDPYFILDYFGTKCVGENTGYGGMDSIIGYKRSFAEGLKYLYPSGTIADSTPDILVPGVVDADSAFISYERGKAYTARGVSFSKTSSEKLILYKTVNVSFNFGSLYSIDPDVPDSIARKTLMARIVGFFGYGKVLLVQDDANDAYRSSGIIEEDLSALNVNYTIWQVPSGGLGPPFKEMCNYSIVIWSCGKETRYNLLADDTLAIEDYINNGGCLFITGENIASELVKLRWRGFLLRVFGADLVSDSVSLDGIYGEDYLSRLSGKLIGSVSPDEILPYGKGFVVVYGLLTSKADPVEGVENEAFLNGGKSVFFSFNYSVIENGVREDFLSRTLEEFYYSYPPLALNFVSFNAFVLNDEVILRFVKESDCGIERWIIDRKREGEEWRRIWEGVYASSRREVIEVKDVPPLQGRYTYRIGGIVNGEEKWFSTSSLIFRKESRGVNIFVGELKNVSEDAEFFDVSGKRVKKIEKPGIYFVKEGERTKKVILLR